MEKRNQVVFNNICDGHVVLSDEFVALFPKMTQLLNKASKVEFTLNGNKRFRQYIWTNADGHTTGWLCRLEHCTPVGRNLIDEHILLSNTMGGIVDYWLADRSEDTKTFIDANIFTFSLTDSRVGVGGWENKYAEACKLHNVEPQDINDFVTFALESNGNTTFYNHKSKEVFVYLHDDYSPFETTPVDDCRDCALFTYDGVTDFVSFVEQLAQQWLDIVK